MGSKSLRKTLTERLSQKITQKLTETAQKTASTASVAKSQLDQTLINLQHAGLKPLRDSQDLISRVGRGVLERAESIRRQIAETPFSPSWLKDVSLAVPSSRIASSARPDVAEPPSQMGLNLGDIASDESTTVSSSFDSDALDAAERGDNLEVLADAASSLTEASISEPAEDMQPASAASFIGSEEPGHREVLEPAPQKAKVPADSPSKSPRSSKARASAQKKVSRASGGSSKKVKEKSRVSAKSSSKSTSSKQHLASRAKSAPKSRKDKHSHA